MVTRIARLDVYRLSVPLVRPYRLSFTEIRAFDTVLTCVRDGDGRTGWGEATLLTGYTEETIDGSYKAACETARAITGLGLEDAKHTVEARLANAPFTATALYTAMEMLEGAPVLRVSDSARVPLLALLHGEAGGELEAEIESLLAEGYQTFKLKVGFNAQKDLEKTRTLQSILAGRGMIRIDANQGFSEKDACRFASSLIPENIELLEQTCPAGDWKAAAHVAAVSAVPLMLDESIYTLEDVERAAELEAASFIKFKLMKAGGLDKLMSALDRIRSLNMTPVLGNGVACDLGCWMEACVAAHTIENAGEMNGYLKISRSLFQRPVPVEHGAMVLARGFAPKIDERALERFVIDRYLKAA